MGVEEVRNMVLSQVPQSLSLSALFLRAPFLVGPIMEMGGSCCQLVPFGGVGLAMLFYGEVVIEGKFCGRFKGRTRQFSYWWETPSLMTLGA